ncbi:hypothetical protein V5O48_009058 [Marasmius crinis-equi]|uniref:Uncharacterized protein n=1 Tax=Marasmius crinis-equi TaxID=585013 RepID=A0ABR3FC96_9AGAR
MEITSAQFDALEDWHSSKPKMRKQKPGSEVDISSADGEASDGDGQEDVQIASPRVYAAGKAEKKVAGGKRKLQVQTDTVQGSATHAKRSKKKALETAELSCELSVGPDLDRNHEAVELAAAGFAYYPVSEQTAAGVQSSSRASANELPAALVQLKREIEEITADLRFKRASKEVAVELYDQTALKLAGIMDRFDVAG